MATRVISTSIKLDGEAEFKKQISAVNSELRTMHSQTVYVTEAFKGNANSLEALTAMDEALRNELDLTNEQIKKSEDFLQVAKEAQKKFAEELEKVKEKAEKQGVSLERLTGNTKDLTDEEQKLARELKEAAGHYNGATDAVNHTTQTLNKARTAEAKLKREIRDNNKYLDEAKDSADGAAKSIDGYGKSVKEAGDKSGGFGSGVKDLAESLGKLKGALVGGAIVGGAKELADAVLDIEESTREYRQIMGTLEVSRREAGYSAEQTAETYERLYSVLGDTQTAATATANLQAIGLRQSELTYLTKEAIGAWATYGDSIPIDGLAESINETIKAGQVTGTFADVLNWGADANETYGVALKKNTKANEEWNKAVEKCSSAEDYFNLALSQCTDNAERADLVMRAMADQGLKDAADAWVEVNGDIVEANEAQAEWDEAMGELGEALVPAANALRRFGANAIGYVTEMVRNAISALQDLGSAMGSFFSGGSDAKSANMVVDEAELALQNAQTYRTSQQLATAGIDEAQGWDSAALHEMAAQVVNGVNAGSAASTPSTVKTSIYIDSREVAQTITPAMRDLDLASPEVTSDR